MNRSFFVFLLLICQSCDWFVKNQQQDKDVVAQVGSSFFYVDDIVYDSSLGDSTKVVSQQINLWLKKQLVLNAAFQNEEIINEIASNDYWTTNNFAGTPTNLLRNTFAIGNNGYLLRNSEATGNASISTNEDIDIQV